MNVAMELTSMLMAVWFLVLAGFRQRNCNFQRVFACSICNSALDSQNVSCNHSHSSSFLSLSNNHNTIFRGLSRLVMVCTPCLRSAHQLYIGCADMPFHPNIRNLTHHPVGLACIWPEHRTENVTHAPFSRWLDH